MLLNYYPIKSTTHLSQYFKAYVPLIKYHLEYFGIDTNKFGIKGDHLGLQVLSKDEFDEAHDLIKSYSKVIKEGVIHERRNNTYQLSEFIFTDGIELQSIEMFEPKPGAEVSKLKPGFEHLAMRVEDYDSLKSYFVENNLPIDKTVEYGGSRFLKTKFVNLVEIEFRDGYLWEDLLREMQSQ